MTKVTLHALPLKSNSLILVKQFLALLLLLGSLQMVAQPVPFTCSTDFYQYRSSDLISFDMNIPGETVINGSSSELLAPRGYNMEDNLIYGYSGSRIFQEDATGNKVYKGTVAGAISSVEAGDFDLSGNLFLYATGKLFSVDVDNPPFSAKIYTLSGSTGLEINDFAYRVVDGKFYAVANNKRLAIIEITGDTTATITTQALSGPLTNLGSPDFASAWFSQSDEFFVFNQYSGVYYRVNLGTGATTNVRTGISSLFNDGMSCPNVTLPLELLSFDARVLGNKTVRLDWETANEENVSHFEVLRSPDGMAWQSVGAVRANNRAVSYSYDFADTPPVMEQLYYSLKMIDDNGTARYSKVIAVKLKPTSPGFSIYPNPSKDHLTIATNFEGNYKVDVFDQTGRLVYSGQLKAPISKLDINFLPPSNYFVRIISGEQVETVKLTKL